MRTRVSVRAHSVRTGPASTPALRRAVGALWLAAVLGLQGCSTLTVMALAEVVSSVNDSLKAQDDPAAASRQPRPGPAAVPAAPRSDAVTAAASQLARQPRYRSLIDRGTIEAGTPAGLYTSTSLDPRSLPSKDGALVETLVVFDPRGREIARLSKFASAGLADGQFTNRFELVLPREAPLGSYRLVTEAFLGYQSVGRDEVSLTLTAPGSQRQRAQAR